MRRFSFTVASSWLCMGLMLGVAAAQPPAEQAGQTFEGTVVYSSRATLTVKEDDGRYRLFILDARTTRPTSIPVRARVRVSYQPTGSDEAPRAETVVVLAMPPAQGAAPPTEEPVPASVRQLEKSIEHQVSRYHVGVRLGTALDPELVMFGVHAEIGPFFSHNVYARPNIDFGFGEVTSLIAFNFEAVYRVPTITLRNRWTPYIGAGPSVILSKQSFSTPTEERNRFDFSDFIVDSGFNFLVGMQSTGGLFLELKGSAYAAPSVRVIVGFVF